MTRYTRYMTRYTTRYMKKWDESKYFVMKKTHVTHIT